MKKKILVIRFGSLGDVVLTSTTLANLGVSFPDHHIIYFTKERFRPLVEQFNYVDEVVPLPESTTIRDYYRLLLDLDRYAFDIVVDLHGNQRSWLALKMITANRKVVYPKRRIKRYLISRRKKRLPVRWPHTIDLYNDTVVRLGGKTPCQRSVLPVSIVDTHRSDLHGLNKDKPMVIIAPGAAHPNKQWPIDRFAEVALELNRIYDATIAWTILATDRGKSGLEKRLPVGSFREFVDTPLHRLTGLISQARVTIANDSGVAHLSSAIGTPVVTVFGPTHRALGFAPSGLFDTIVEVDEFCRPCSLHGKKPCYREKRYCFDRITPEMVSKAAGRLLDLGIGTKRALFVDRDGTMIVDKVYLSDPEQVEFLEGSVKALRLAKKMGLTIVIVSNQSGVARGMFDCSTVEKVNGRMLEMLASDGIEVDGFYYCPHHPQGRVPEYTLACDCRKPAPGMLEEAAKQLNINLHKSYVIGDKLDDFNLGRVVGAQSYLVRTGYGARQENRLPDSCTNGNKCVFDNLLMAVQHIKMIEENDKGSRPL